MKKTTKSTTGGAPCFCREAGEAFTELLHRLAPPADARRHFESARLEILRGLRALLDARIDRHSKTKSRGQSINVE